MRTPSATPLICVSDIDRSSNFYEKVLGFATVGNFAGKHPGLAAATQVPDANLHARKLQNGDGVFIELVLFREPTALPAESAAPINRIGLAHFVFHTPDLSATLAALAAFDRPPAAGERSPLPGGMEGVFASDPDGVRIEFVTGSAGMGYSHPALSVRDLGRSTRFYSALGYSAVRRDDYPAAAWSDRLNGIAGLALSSQMLENAGGDKLQLIEVTHPAMEYREGVRPFARQGWVNLGFDVDNLDNTAARLGALGGAMIDGTRAVIGPREQWHGTDPDGIRVKIVAPAPEA